MRLDLFLKATRAKPAKEIKAGDTLRLSYPSRIVDIEVLVVPASSKNVKAPPEELYRVTGEQRLPRDTGI